MPSGKVLPFAHLAAEAIVAVTFSVGADVIDQPKHKRLDIAERISREIELIVTGAWIRGRLRK